MTTPQVSTPETAALSAAGQPQALAGNLGLALMLAAAGQWLLMARPAAPGLGLLCFALAGAVFVALGWQSGGQRGPGAFTAAAAVRGAPALGLWATSLALGLYAVVNVNKPSAMLHNYLLVAAWLSSMALFAYSVLAAAGWQKLPRTALLASWQAARHKHWREWLLLAGLLAAALAVRVYDLEAHPYSFINDEGEVGKAAVSILSGARSDFFHTGWSAQPMWSFAPTALSVLLFGNTAFAARLVSALQGALGVVFLYGLAREAFDRATAILAAVLLLGLAWHVHFSRLGVNNLIDSFFATGVLWLLFRALRRGGLPDYLWAGLAAGLTVYSYLGSRLVMGLAVGLLGYAALTQRGYLRTHVRHLLVFGVAMLLAAAPMLAYFARHQDIFFARVNAENILVNGWLVRRAAETGQSAASLLLDQFRRSTLVFVAGSAPGHFFNTPRPYLAPPAAVFFGLGLAWAISRIWQPRCLMVLAWFFAVVVLGSALTLGPPSSQRLIMSAPAAALLAAIGLREAARAAAQADLLPSRMGLALAGIVACLVAAQGVLFYFGPYRAGHFFEDRANELSYEAARQAGEISAEGDYRLLLLGHPNVFAVFANFAYFAPDVPVTDFNTTGQAEVAALPRDRGAFFVAQPGRVEELRQIAEWLPGGEWHEVPRRNQPEQVLYYAYRLTPAQFAQR